MSGPSTAISQDLDATQAHENLFQVLGESTGVPRLFYTTAEVCECLGVHRLTLTKWRKRGYFPEPRKLGPQRIGWLVSDLNHWAHTRPPAKLGGDTKTKGEADLA